MTPFAITTIDNINIHVLANNPRSASRGMLCFHMMPATKESYSMLLDFAETHNILAWAIDFRGHGESTNSGKLDYHSFSNTEHANYILDARAVYEEMKKTIMPSIVVGASIGANIALQLQVEFAIPESILLSPGLDYRGVETLPSAKQLTSNQSCFIISSEEVHQNGDFAKVEAEAIFNTIPSTQKKIKIYPSTAHGTNILDTDASAIEDIEQFITD